MCLRPFVCHFVDAKLSLKHLACYCMQIKNVNFINACRLDVWYVCGKGQLKGNCVCTLFVNVYEFLTYIQTYTNYFQLCALNRTAFFMQQKKLYKHFFLSNCTPLSIFHQLYEENIESDRSYKPMSIRRITIGLNCIDM